MEYVSHEIRLRVLGSGLYNAVSVVRSRGQRGACLDEQPRECRSGPCSDAQLARQRCEDRTRQYLATHHAD